MSTDYASKARALYQAVNLCNNFDEAVAAIATALRDAEERATAKEQRACHRVAMRVYRELPDRDLNGLYAAAAIKAGITNRSGSTTDE